MLIITILTPIYLPRDVGPVISLGQASNPSFVKLGLSIPPLWDCSRGETGPRIY